MTPDMLDLARRAVACKGWRWVPVSFEEFMESEEYDNMKCGERDV